jgi:alkylated DNA nucleotide flippase Atl1
LRIVAETAEEDKEKGKKRVTPYWRMLKDDGTLNPKFPGGEETQAEKLRNEGFTIIKKGRTKLMVEDFEKYLIDLL